MKTSFNREHFLGLLAFIFLIWAVFATSYAVKLKIQLEGQARRRPFSAKQLRRHPDLKRFFESAEWQALARSREVQAFLASDRFKRIAKSYQWQLLRNSPALTNFFDSLEVASLAGSTAWRQLATSQSVREARSRFRREGRVGISEVRNIFRSPEWATFFKKRRGAPSDKQSLSGSLS